MRRLRVLTWHVHGNYLLYLSRAGAELYLLIGSDCLPDLGFWRRPGRIAELATLFLWERPG